jgi:hypothetical protein
VGRIGERPKEMEPSARRQPHTGQLGKTGAPPNRTEGRLVSLIWIKDEYFSAGRHHSARGKC